MDPDFKELLLTFNAQEVVTEVKMMAPMNKDYTTESVINSSPDILGGTPVFKGTRVPVSTLFDYLAAGDALERFLDHFPTVAILAELKEKFDAAA